MVQTTLAKIKEHLVDKYLTWKTGDNKDTRDWKAWYNVNVNYRADTIDHMFQNFAHIIEVDWKKFVVDDGLAWVPVESARQYFWPQRKLGDNAVWRMERVSRYNYHSPGWYIDELCGEDRIFVATNNDNDAIMLSLLYS